MYLKKDTQSHDDVSFQNKLALRRTVYVGNTAVLTSVHERRASYLIPHLSGNHYEAEKHGSDGPHLFVVKEIQIISPQIEESSAQQYQHHDSDGS